MSQRTQSARRGHDPTTHTDGHPLSASEEELCHITRARILLRHWVQFLLKPVLEHMTRDVISTRFKQEKIKMRRLAHVPGRRDDEAFLPLLLSMCSLGSNSQCSSQLNPALLTISHMNRIWKCFSPACCERKSDSNTPDEP